MSCRRLLLKPISPIYLLTLANKWFCVGILLILVCDKQCISLIQCNTLSLPTHFSSMIFQFYIFTSLPRSILNPLHSCQWTTSLSHFSVKCLCGCLTLQTFLRRAGRHVIQLPMYVVTAPWKVWNKFSVLPKLFHIPVKSKRACLKVHRKTVPAEWEEDLLLAIPLSHGVQLTATRLFRPPACNPACECNPLPERWCGLCLVCASETELGQHQFLLPSWTSFAKQIGTKSSKACTDTTQYS